MGQGDRNLRCSPDPTAGPSVRNWLYSALDRTRFLGSTTHRLMTRSHPVPTAPSTSTEKSIGRLKPLRVTRKQGRGAIGSRVHRQEQVRLRRTDALMSRQETGKITASDIPVASGCHPAVPFLNALSRSWFARSTSSVLLASLDSPPACSMIGTHAGARGGLGADAHRTAASWPSVHTGANARVSLRV